MKASLWLKNRPLCLAISQALITIPFIPIIARLCFLFDLPPTIAGLLIAALVILYARWFANFWNRYGLGDSK